MISVAASIISERRVRVAGFPDGADLTLYREGPFIAVKLNGVVIGRARKKKSLISGGACNQCECLVIRDYVICLTDEEEQATSSMTEA